MFSKKVSQKQSSAKLLKILTNRSLHKRLSIKKGVYDEWPTQQKPSLLNCSTNYLKYLNSEKKQEISQKQNSISIKKSKSSSILKKVAATFSTCTTMEFLPTTQYNIQTLSKFTTTPKSQYEEQQNGFIQKQKFKPYGTPEQDSQILEENQSSLNPIQDDDYQTQLNSKYNNRPQTSNYKHNRNEQRRLIKTAKINRQKLQIDEPNTEVVNIKKPYITRPPSGSSVRPISGNYVRPTTANFNQVKLPQNSFNHFNTLKRSTSNSSLRQFNNKKIYDCPMRLKDYETNFQAFKVISELIDQQMKWQPKKRTPRKSVSFRKYPVSAKA